MEEDGTYREEDEDATNVEVAYKDVGDGMEEVDVVGAVRDRK
jgi:hypothetical protein